MNSDSSHPLTAGLRAARANFLPGLVIQIATVALVVSYYTSPGVQQALEALEQFKTEHGYLFAFVSGAVAGGLLPEVLMVIFFQRGRPTRENGRRLLYMMALWGGGAVLVDAFYRFQGTLFGTAADSATVVSKMLFDQFVFTPFLALPYSILGFKLWNRELPTVREFFTPGYYWRELVPTLVANWGVWIPLVCLVYAMPSALQVPLYSLILAFWVLLFSWINRKK